jgi:hypothetical protein
VEIAVAVVPPDLVDRSTGVGLIKDRHNLRFGEPRLAHGNLLARVTVVARKFSFLTVSIYGELTASI